MVECYLPIGTVFASLADPTRRDILRRVATAELSVGDIAKDYDMSLAAVSKHLKIMEQACLVRKRRLGKQHLIRAHPEGLRDASAWLKQYEALWNERFDRLDQLVKEGL